MVLELSWFGHQCDLKILSMSTDHKHEATVWNGIQQPNIVSQFHYWEVQSDLKSFIVKSWWPIDLHIEPKRQQSSSTTLQGKPIDSKMVVTMPLSLPVAIHIMLQVAEGMRYWHINRTFYQRLKDLQHFGWTSEREHNNGTSQSMVFGGEIGRL